VAELNADDRLSRFIVTDRHFARAAGHVRRRAFEPSKRDNSTSVFETTGLSNESVWSIGDEHVAGPRGPVLARGDIAVSHVRESGLVVERSDPPPRHASIIGWPPDKHEVMSMCEKLAKRATLVLPTDP
jgi:hypothetical protein